MDIGLQVQSLYINYDIFPGNVCVHANAKGPMIIIQETPNHFESVTESNQETFPESHRRYMTLTVQCTVQEGSSYRHRLIR